MFAAERECPLLLLLPPFLSNNLCTLVVLLLCPGMLPVLAATHTRKRCTLCWLATPRTTLFPRPPTACIVRLAPAARTDGGGTRGLVRRSRHCPSSARRLRQRHWRARRSRHLFLSLPKPVCSVYPSFRQFAYILYLFVVSF